MLQEIISHTEHAEKPPRHVSCLPRPFRAEHHRQLVCVPSQYHQKWHIVTYMAPTSTIRTQKASPQPTLTNPDERVRERLTPRTRTPTFQHCFFPSLARLAYPLQALLRLRLCPNSKKSANKHLPIPPNIHRTGVSTTCGVSCLSVQPRKSWLSTAGQMERYTRVAPR
jgi:hypothetical protein